MEAPVPGSLLDAFREKVEVEVHGVFELQKDGRLVFINSEGRRMSLTQAVQAKDPEFPLRGAGSVRFRLNGQELVTPLGDPEPKPWVPFYIPLLHDLIETRPGCKCGFAFCTACAYGRKVREVAWAIICDDNCPDDTAHPNHPQPKEKRMDLPPRPRYRPTGGVCGICERIDLPVEETGRLFPHKDKRTGELCANKEGFYASTARIAQILLKLEPK